MSYRRTNGADFADYPAIPLKARLGSANFGVLSNLRARWSESVRSILALRYSFRALGRVWKQFPGCEP